MGSGWKFMAAKCQRLGKWDGEKVGEAQKVVQEIDIRGDAVKKHSDEF
jgi:hypothetical protein